MYLLSVLLIAILLTLYLVYTKICSLIKIIEEEREPRLEEHYPERRTVKSWVYFIRNGLTDTNEHLKMINQALNWKDPAGSNSKQSRRFQNLMKLYTDYLRRNFNLNEDEAIARAHFEFSKFDIDKLTSVIDNETDITRRLTYDLREDIDKNFYETGLLEKDCQSALSRISASNIVIPVWALFKANENNISGKKIRIATWKEESYEDFVNNRAFVLKLLDSGIIKKTGKIDHDDGWLLDPCFKFTIVDIETIVDILGEPFQYNSLQKKYEKGLLYSIFEISRF